MSNLTKAQRIAAYKIVSAHLERAITPTQINRAVDPEVFTLSQKSEIIERAQHILANLSEDAKDLWDES